MRTGTAEQVDYYRELEKPIIFIGCPRSGTSIISEIIMRHPHIAYPSQYQDRFLKKTWINYFRRVFDNQFWRFHGQKKQLNKVSVANKLIFRTSENYRMWDAITEKEIEFGLSFLLKMTPSTKNVAFQRKFFRNIVRNQGKKRLAFKITGPSRLEFLLSIFPDANIVRIQRGTIATIRSLLKVHFWKSRGYHKFWWKGAYNADECEWAIKNTDNPIAITAYQVQRIVDITNYEIQKLQPIVLDIEYETFVRSPENTINEILDFANLPKDDSCFNYLKENKIFNRNRNLNDFFEENDIDTINTTINLSSSFFNPNKPIHC